MGISFRPCAHNIKKEDEGDEPPRRPEVRVVPRVLLWSDCRPVRVLGALLSSVNRSISREEEDSAMPIVGVATMGEVGDRSSVGSSASARKQQATSKASDPTTESDPDDPMPIRDNVPGLVSFFTSGPGRSEWPLE